MSNGLRDQLTDEIAVCLYSSSTTSLRRTLGHNTLTFFPIRSFHNTAFPVNLNSFFRHTLFTWGLFGCRLALYRVNGGKQVVGKSRLNTSLRTPSLPEPRTRSSTRLSKSVTVGLRQSAHDPNRIVNYACSTVASPVMFGAETHVSEITLRR